MDGFGRARKFNAWNVTSYFASSAEKNQMKWPAQNRKDVFGLNAPNEQRKNIPCPIHSVSLLVKYLTYLWICKNVAVGRACLCVFVCVISVFPLAANEISVWIPLFVIYTKLSMQNRYRFVCGILTGVKIILHSKNSPGVRLLPCIWWERNHKENNTILFLFTFQVNSISFWLIFLIQPINIVFFINLITQ